MIIDKKHVRWLSKQHKVPQRDIKAVLISSCKTDAVQLIRENVKCTFKQAKNTTKRRW